MVVNVTQLATTEKKFLPRYFVHALCCDKRRRSFFFNHFLQMMGIAGRFDLFWDHCLLCAKPKCFLQKYFFINNETSFHGENMNWSKIGIGNIRWSLYHDLKLNSPLSTCRVYQAVEVRCTSQRSGDLERQNYFSNTSLLLAWIPSYKMERWVKCFSLQCKHHIYEKRDS